MRRLLQEFCVAKSRPLYVFIRGAASEPVAQCIEGSADKSVTHGQRWQPHENLVLISAIEKQEQDLRKAGKISMEQTRREKWEEIETLCQDSGISRSSEQCRQRWIRLLHAFSKVRDWERSRPPGRSSFWVMKAGEKKIEGLSFSLDMETFKAMDGLHYEEKARVGTDCSDIEAESTERPAEPKSGDAETDASMGEDDHVDKIETNGGPSEVDCGDKEETNDGSSEAALCKYNAQMRDHEDVDSPKHIQMEDSATDQGSSEETSLSRMSYTRQASLDDRPIVLVNIFNQCLNSLKGGILHRNDLLEVPIDRGSVEDTWSKNAERPTGPSGSSSMRATTHEKGDRP